MALFFLFFLAFFFHLAPLFLSSYRRCRYIYLSISLSFRFGCQTSLTRRKVRTRSMTGFEIRITPPVVAIDRLDADQLKENLRLPPPSLPRVIPDVSMNESQNRKRSAATAAVPSYYFSSCWPIFVSGFWYLSGSATYRFGAFTYESSFVGGVYMS